MELIIIIIIITIIIIIMIMMIMMMMMMFNCKSYKITNLIIMIRKQTFDLQANE